MSAVISRRAVWLGACAIGLVASRHAEAHAQLLSATPAVGSSIGEVPDQLSLVFSEGVEPAFSSIQVTDVAGVRVDRDDLRRNPQKPGGLIVGLKKLTPGIYRVQWKVTSVDTHKSQGNFTFTVVAP